MNGDGEVMCIGQAWEYTKVLCHLKVEFDADGEMTCFGFPPGLVGTDFSIDDAYTVLPFSNTLVTMTMTGTQIKTLLEAAVSYLLSPG
eukprot:1497056-Amphidinium_carterae.1